MTEYKDRVRRELYDCVQILYPSNKTFDEVIELINRALENVQMNEEKVNESTTIE